MQAGLEDGRRLVLRHAVNSTTSGRCLLNLSVGPYNSIITLNPKPGQGADRMRLSSAGMAGKASCSRCAQRDDPDSRYIFISLHHIVDSGLGLCMSGTLGILQLSSSAPHQSTRQIRPNSSRQHGKIVWPKKGKAIHLA